MDIDKVSNQWVYAWRSFNRSTDCLGPQRANRPQNGERVHPGSQNEFFTRPSSTCLDMSRFTKTRLHMIQKDGHLFDRVLAVVSHLRSNIGGSNYDCETPPDLNCPPHVFGMQFSALPEWFVLGLFN